MSETRILIAEDEPHLREILRLQLECEGYRVLEAADGREAVDAAFHHLPDLILLDVMMPELDGLEVHRRLREAFSTRHIPVILLTARASADEKVSGLADGVNDYVTKPWDRRELLLRVRNLLEWSHQQRAASPLTGLPGNHSINDEIRKRLASGHAFALLQLDVDHFKAFNDQYGYGRGDQAIQMLARILIDCTHQLGGEQGFVGHIGGDDFVVLTSPDRAEDLGGAILDRFNQESAQLYDREDRERGYVEVLNRRHVVERFPLMSLTIALVSTDRVPVTHLAELIDIAQELKAHGKGIAGSVLVGERRAREGPESDRHVA